MIAIAPIHANVDGVVDNIGTVAGASEMPPPRYVGPSAPVTDPIRFPIDAGVVRPAVRTLRAPTTTALDPILNPPPIVAAPIAPGSPTGRLPGVPTVPDNPASRPYDPAYQTPPSTGFPNGPSTGFGYTPPSGPTIGFGYTPTTNKQVPPPTDTGGMTTLPTVTVIANQLSANWKLVAGIGLVIVLLVAFLRFRR